MALALESSVIRIRISIRIIRIRIISIRIISIKKMISNDTSYSNSIVLMFPYVALCTSITKCVEVLLL